MNRPYVASFSHQLISSSSSNETSKHPEKISVIHVFLAKKNTINFPIHESRAVRCKQGLAHVSPGAAFLPVAREAVACRALSHSEWPTEDC